MNPPTATFPEVVSPYPCDPELPWDCDWESPGRQGSASSPLEPASESFQEIGLDVPSNHETLVRPVRPKDALVSFLERGLLATSECQLRLERWSELLTMSGHRQEADACADAARLIRTGPASRLAGWLDRVRALPQEAVIVSPDPRALAAKDLPALCAEIADASFLMRARPDSIQRQINAALLLSRGCEESARSAFEACVPSLDAAVEPMPRGSSSAVEWNRESRCRERGASAKRSSQLRELGRVTDPQEGQHPEALKGQAQRLEALGSLAGGIAHDFNNLLTAILSFAELSRLENPDNAGLQENLRQIQLAGNRATELVRRILAFSRKQKIERRPVPLGPVIGEALALLRSTLPTTLRICEQLDSGLPQAMADPTQIHQVVMNLATNAAHAMRGRQGRLTVKLSLAPQAGRITPPQVDLCAMDYLHLSVSDTGHGMDETTLRHVFEPFFTTKAPGEGTGLGLAMVHGIVKEHEGVLSVTSKVGVGTTFHIYLPVATRMTEFPVDPPSQVPRGSGERILFVDDEPALCAAIARTLAHLGYEAVAFRDPEEARRAFEREPEKFHAVVTDLTMPGLTGLDLARAVLATRPETPVILCSGQDSTSMHEAVRQLGIRAVLPKPLERAALALAIHRALRPLA